LNDTIHLHDLSPVERLLEEAAERGFVEEKDIQALADEHELTEDDVTGLRAALEERDVVVLRIKLDEVSGRTVER